MRPTASRSQVGLEARASTAARSPSSLMFGGIRTSTIVASGRWSSTARRKLGASSTAATTSQSASVGGRTKALPKGTEVIGHHHTHAITLPYRLVRISDGYSALRF